MNPRARMQFVMWSALFMSILIYLVIAWITVAPKNAGTLEDALGKQVVLVLWGLAVLAFFGGFAVRRMLAPREPEFPQPATASAGPAVAPWQIMQWAIFESAAIFGLLAAFISQIWTAAVPPIALAIAGFVLTMPRASSEAS